MAIGDEGLLPVDDIFIALQTRACLDAFQVGPGARFGHRDGGNDLAARHLGKPCRLLFLRAEVHQIGRDDIGMQGKPGARGMDLGQFLHDDGGMAEIAAAAAVFLGDGGQQEAHFPGLAPKRLGHDVVTVPLIVMGHDLGFAEFAETVAQGFVVVAVGACHGGPQSLSFRAVFRILPVGPTGISSSTTISVGTL